MIGFPWGESHVKRSYASTGGTVAAMHDVMRGRARTAMQLAGGTHHAFFNHGEGFCVFNDQAVAAGVAMRDYGDRCLPILIIDLDVHQASAQKAPFACACVPHGAQVLAEDTALIRFGRDFRRPSAGQRNCQNIRGRIASRHVQHARRAQLSLEVKDAKRLRR